MNETSLPVARRAARGLLILIGGISLAGAAPGCVIDDAEDEVDRRGLTDIDGRDGDDDRRDDDEPGDPDPDDCVSVHAGFGLVCTTCPGDEEPECLVASCGPMGSCTTEAGEEATVLECMDPRGRIATDCSTEWSGDYGGISFGGGDFLHSCGVIYGHEAGTTSTCHYPGFDTCRVDNGCLHCGYQDGSSNGVCREDLPTMEDLLAGHPEGLPEPGECMTETVQDGLVECSTCTREDLSATTSCRFAESTCDDTEHEEAYCIGCALVTGGEALVCDPPVD